MVVLLASCAKTHVGFQRTCDVLSQGPDYARCEGIQLFFVCLFVYSKQIFVFFLYLMPFLRYNDLLLGAFSFSCFPLLYFQVFAFCCFRAFAFLLDAFRRTHSLFNRFYLLSAVCFLLFWLLLLLLSPFLPSTSCLVCFRVVASCRFLSLHVFCCVYCACLRSAI